MNEPGFVWVQDEGDVAIGCSEKVPGGQNCGVSDPATEYMPAGVSRHLVPPSNSFEFLYVPGGQIICSILATEGTKCPSDAIIHDEAPELGWYVPAGQAIIEVLAFPGT